MAKMRARRISGSRWVTRSGSRPSGIARASRSAMPSRRSAWASNMTPPSELIRPPSKAAVIFLRRTAGKQNGRRLSSVMAGVRASIPAKGWLQQPNPTPDQQLTLLPPPLIRPRHEYDRLAWLYGLPSNRAAEMLHTQWKEIFRDHPLRLTLGELPLVDGQSGSFKQQIDVEIAAFKQRWDWVMQPLVNPVALEVIVSTSASVPKDLDNIVREYLLPKFVPSFGTVTDYTFTADFEELAKRDANILMKWGPTPPKST